MNECINAHLHKMVKLIILYLQTVLKSVSMRVVVQYGSVCERCSVRLARICGPDLMTIVKVSDKTLTDIQFL